MVVEFNGFSKGVLGKKLPSDSTLNNMKKPELIKMLRLMQKNYDALASFYAIAIDTSKCNDCPLSQGWISVNDRLPDKPGSYLVVGKTGGATVTRWYPPSKHNDYKGHFGGNRREYIRFWMPRPEPPERRVKQNDF